MNMITLFVSLLLAACSAGSSSNSQTVEKAVVISETEFKQLVMNYEANPQEWIFKGELPTIVNFTADWCAPCRRMAPIFDALAREYQGRVNIFKVNVDHSRNLAGYFGIRSIPTTLFCPMKGLPALHPGTLTREQLVEAIENFLLGGDRVYHD